MNIIQIIENKIMKNNKLINKEEERVQKILNMNYSQNIKVH
jgi:hypothetical protein